MSWAQLTFWWVGAALFVACTVFFYPGVRRHAPSAKESLLAATMAALLCAAGGALTAAFAVNAVSQLFGGASAPP